MLPHGQKWTITEIDGKIASVSVGFSLFAEIAAKISSMPDSCISEIKCRKTVTEEIFEISKTVGWNDLMLFGSDFQKKVWKNLFSLTHCEAAHADLPYADKSGYGLMSYSEFAELCGNRSAARAVAHAVAMNPVAIIIPCHLIVPQEVIHTLQKKRRQAEPSLFGNVGLPFNSRMDFGEYRYGRTLKAALIEEALRSSGESVPAPDAGQTNP